MTILVVGTGFIGLPLADRLHEAGHRVIGLTRSAETVATLSSSRPWTAVAADVTAPETLAALPDEIDVVVHCASSSRGGADMYRAVYYEGIQTLAKRWPKARLVFTSSTSVYPQTDGSTVTEESPAEPDRETGHLLRATEEFVLARSGTVARLAGLYGPGRSFVLKNLLEGRATIEGNDGHGRLLNQAHCDDTVSALVHLIERGLSGIYNVSDDEPVTQREAYLTLCPLFNVPLPPAVPPATERKRGWTHKAVSNAKLRATGWTPKHPGYRHAVMHDPLLVSSIFEQVMAEGHAVPRAPNIIVIGLMGCGKSTVGRIVSSMIGFQFVDTDQLITEQAQMPIPKIFEREGEAGFRQRESAVLRSLLGRRGHVIATGGGIVTQPHNLPLLKHLGYVVWLDADITTLHRRTASSTDRPLLATDEDPKARLQRLYDARRHHYTSLADLRIKTDTLSPQETAYGVAESARVWFSRQGA